MDMPLRSTVETYELTMKVGLNTIAFAVSGNNLHVGDPKYKVTHLRRFAHDIRAAMLREAEDGSTPLSDFLDEMVDEAIERGSEHVEEVTCSHCEELRVVGPDHRNTIGASHDEGCPKAI